MVSDWISDDDIAATFRDHWQTLRADHWAPLTDDSDTIARRVKGFARQHSPSVPWGDAIAVYLSDVRLAWAAARGLPLLGPGTTAWRLAGAQFVRRMAGSYRLRDLRGACDGDWETVQWVRLSDATAMLLQQLARDSGCTVSQLLSVIIEAWAAEWRE